MLDHSFHSQLAWIVTNISEQNWSRPVLVSLRYRWASWLLSQYLCNLHVYMISIFVICMNTKDSKYIPLSTLMEMNLCMLEYRAPNLLSRLPACLMKLYSALDWPLSPLLIEPLLSHTKTTWALLNGWLHLNSCLVAVLQSLCLMNVQCVRMVKVVTSYPEQTMRESNRQKHIP